MFCKDWRWLYILYRISCQVKFNCSFWAYISVATLAQIDAHISSINKNSLAHTHLQSTGVKWSIWWTQHPRFLLWRLFWTCRSSRDAGIRRTQSGSADQWRRLNGRFPFRCHSLNITLTIKSCQTSARAVLLTAERLSSYEVCQQILWVGLGGGHGRRCWWCSGIWQVTQKEEHTSTFL